MSRSHCNMTWVQLVCHASRAANTQFYWETLRFDSPDQRRIGAPPIRRRLSSAQRLGPLHVIDDVLQGVVGLVVEEDFVVEVTAGAVAGVADEVLKPKPWVNTTACP